MPDYSGHMTQDEYRELGKRELVRVCRLIIARKYLAVDGCIEVVCAAQQALDPEEIESDPDLRCLGGISSEFDLFPEPSLRKRLSAELLARRDREKREAEEFYGADIRAACGRILQRYGSIEEGENDA